MEKFLYIFGYKSPYCAPRSKQLRIDDDSEDTMSFFISAENKDKALEWGNILGTAYMQTIYEYLETKERKYRDQLWYQGWIGDQKEWEEWQLKDINAISYGEMPDMKEIVAKRYGSSPF